MTTPALQTLAGFRVMAQHEDLLRLRDDATGLECVLSYSASAHQVYSVGLDSPASGRWYARPTADGVRYVACFRSPSAARRRFARAVGPCLDADHG